MEEIPKPDQLLALHDVTAELFQTLRRWFEVPDTATIDLTAIDSAVTEMSDPAMIAAMAMRKLQALNLLSTPGVRTSTDVVVAIVQDLQRALAQAPTMRLRVAAAHTDWDEAFLDLISTDAETAPSVDDDDEEADRFRFLHGQLNEAMLAVLQASDGQIRYLI